MRFDLLICSAVVILDQLTKALVMSELLPYESIAVIPEFFRINYVLNPGAAFGIMPHQRGLFILLTVAILIAAVAGYPRLKKHYPPVAVIGTMCLVGGAIGNLIDRIRFGHVIDFFDFSIWPAIFNVADIAIVIGGLICTISILLRTEERLNQPKML